MTLLSLPAALLDALGRQGTRAVALSLFAGLALPQLSAALKPWLPEMIFAFLALAFVRIDMGAARGLAREPLRMARAVAWIVLALPLMCAGALALAGRGTLDPGLVLGIALQAASSPILSTPALAVLLGLDATFALLALVAAMALLPLSAPLLASFVAGAAVPVDRWLIGRNLFLLIGGAALVAAGARRACGVARIAGNARRLDGLNVVFLFIFAVAIMDGVPAAIAASPLHVLALVALAYAIAIAGLGAAWLVLAHFSRGDAFVTGLATGHRNAGLMVAALGGVMPDETWLYFAALQFPIYTMPFLVGPLARQVNRLPEGGGLRP